MTDEKLNEAYYQLHHLWTGGKTIRKLHKIMSIPKKGVNTWLAKPALWQVHMPPPEEMNHPHYDVTKFKAQHQFDLFYVPHNVFERNTYKYILRCLCCIKISTAQTMKFFADLITFTEELLNGKLHFLCSDQVIRALKTKTASEVSFVL